MFRSINSSLDRKKSDLAKTDIKTTSIVSVFNQFLSQDFADYKDFFKWVIEYNPKDGGIIIKTESKVIANELSLKIVSFTKLLKENSIRVSKIIIL